MMLFARFGLPIRFSSKLRPDRTDRQGHTVRFEKWSFNGRQMLTLFNEHLRLFRFVFLYFDFLPNRVDLTWKCFSIKNPLIYKRRCVRVCDTRCFDGLTTSQRQCVCVCVDVCRQGEHLQCFRFGTQFRLKLTHFHHHRHISLHCSIVHNSICFNGFFQKSFFTTPFRSIGFVAFGSDNCHTLDSMFLPLWLWLMFRFLPLARNSKVASPYIPVVTLFHTFCVDHKSICWNSCFTICPSQSTDTNSVSIIW